ncbi:MAG: hypothetical protein WCK78_12925 [Paludibacter sp.]
MRTLSYWVLFFLSNSLIAQNYTFTWKLSCSLGGQPDEVTITRIDSLATINYLGPKIKATSQRFPKVDSDSLTRFLSTYVFENRTSNTIIKDIKREYFETKFLPDGERAVVNNDTLHLNTRYIQYYFDPELKKYYHENYCRIDFTDGSNYIGEYITNQGVKKFDIYCAQINEKDYELNKMIIRFINRYFKEINIKRLEKDIVSDKPRKY